MEVNNSTMTRRRFLATTAKASTVLAAPVFVPGSALGKDGGVAASERITVGGIGINGRGAYVLGALLSLPDTKFVAICDVRADRRKAVKDLADTKYGNKDCATYRDLRELLARSDIDAVLIATGDRWHALASIMAAKAGKDVYCEKPCSMTMRREPDPGRHHAALRECVSGRNAAAKHRQFPVRGRSGSQREAGKTPHPARLPRLLRRRSPRRTRSPRLAAGRAGAAQGDAGLGPVAGTGSLATVQSRVRAGPDCGGWLSYFDFNAGGGLLNWASHTVDLCQWANQADGTTPVEFEPVGTERGHAAKRVVHARYANGVKLVMRPCDDKDWLPLGSCQVRFEGEEGWVETGDSDEVALYPETLRTERTVFDKVDTLPRVAPPQFLRLREIPGPAGVQRRHCPLFACGRPMRRPLPGCLTARWRSTLRKKRSSATTRPIACGRAPCASLGSCSRCWEGFRSMDP